MQDAYKLIAMESTPTSDVKPQSDEKQSDAKQSDAKKQKGRVKKLRRWAAAGDVYTRARLAECAAHGVDAKLTAETAPPAKGGRVPTVKGDVGTIVWRALAPSLDAAVGAVYADPASEAEARREWPPWLRLGNAARARRVVLAVAPGVADASAVPFLRGGVAARVYGKRHGDADRDALDAVAAAPPPWEAPPPKRKKGSGGRRAQKRRRKEAARAAEASSDDDEEPDVDLTEAPWALLRDAVLTRAQLAANDYPLPREAAPRHVALEVEDDGEDLGVVDGAAAYGLPSRPRAAAILERCGAETVRRSGAPPGARRRVFGLDCEMVQTTAGARVARCTLVDGAGAVVFDELARPAEKVVDYCTRWSGLDEAALRGVATTVDQVRAALLETVDADDVLVGHSLDCDLRALGLAHHACADTALLYGHPRGAPYKKKLKQLAKEFLDREIQDGAHDSAVDARAALDLFALRVARGPAFAGGAEDAFARLARHGCRVCVVGDAATLQRRATGAVSAVRATGAGVAAAAAQKHAEGWNLVVARLEEGGDLDGAGRVLEAGLADDALLVVVAQPPLDEANRLARQKRLATDPRASTVWTAEREKACAAALQAASYAAVVVKTGN